MAISIKLFHYKSKYSDYESHEIDICRDTTAKKIVNTLHRNVTKSTYERMKRYCKQNMICHYETQTTDKIFEAKFYTKRV